MLIADIHFVESATANTFIVNVPHVIHTTGNIILTGITITTDTDHGINAPYPGKRIAVHQADPRYYNHVFKVDSIDSNTTITIADAFSYADVANTMFNPVVTTQTQQGSVKQSQYLLIILILKKVL